jgi:hypothetical protein
MAMIMRQSVLGGMKRYVLVRWKKRWPIVPVTPFFVASWAMTADPYKVHRQLHRTVIGAVILSLLEFCSHFDGEAKIEKIPKGDSRRAI